MIEIPYFLYIAENRRIYAHKILKLVYKQRETLLL